LEKALFAEVAEASFKIFLEEINELPNRKIVGEKLYILLDLLECLEKLKEEYFKVIQIQKLNNLLLSAIQDLKTTIAMILKQVLVTIPDSKVKVSLDGSVSQTTSNSITLLKRLLEYKDTCEIIFQEIIFNDDNVNNINNNNNNNLKKGN
jgi:hypothetical protein